MTIIAAVSNGKKAWIGSDTWSDRGSGAVETREFKGLQTPGWVIGHTGLCSSLQLITFEMSKLSHEVQASYSDPVRFAEWLRQFDLSGDEPFNRFLHVQPSRVSIIDNHLFTYPIETEVILTIGSGEEYAQGALWRKLPKKFRRRVEVAIMAAIDMDEHCGGEPVILEVR